MNYKSKSNPTFDYEATLAEMARRGIVPGKIYKTTTPVENPKPDKRKTRDWRARMSIEVGTRVLVTDTQWELSDTKNERPYYNFEPAAHAFPTLYRVPMYTSLFDAILKQGGLMPDHETLDDVLTAARHTTSAEDVLQRLIISGKLTLDDVQNAVYEAIEEEKQQLADWREQHKDDE